MAQPRFQIKLKNITDRHSLYLIQSLYQAKSNNQTLSSSHTNKQTPRKRTFILQQEQQGAKEESKKMVTFLRDVSFDTIQFILSVLSCVFSLLIVYTRNVSSDFLHTSISISTIAIEITLICKYFLAEGTFRIGQVVQIILYLIHPNLFTPSINGYLHLILLCRLHIVLKFILRNRVYLNIRTDRVVESNGLAPSGMIFAIKAQLMEMSSKTLLLIYGIAIVIFSHCLYVSINSESPNFDQIDFSECIFAIAETMTLIGFQDGYQSDAARIVAIFSLIVGQCLNSTMILINIKSLTMTPSQKNAHQLFHCLLQRQELQKSAVKLLQFNHKFKNDNSMNHPSQYHKMALQIRANRKNLYKTTRSGVVENLSMTFMEGCFRLKQHTSLTYNYIDKILSVLFKVKRSLIPKPIQFSASEKQEREEEDSDSDQFQIDNLDVNRKFKRTIRRRPKIVE